MAFIRMLFVPWMIVALQKWGHRVMASPRKKALIRVYIQRQDRHINTNYKIKISDDTMPNSPPPPKRIHKICEPSPLYLKYEPHIAKAKAIWGKWKSDLLTLLFFTWELQHWTWTIEAETWNPRLLFLAYLQIPFANTKQGCFIAWCGMRMVGLRVLVPSVPGSQSNSSHALTLPKKYVAPFGFFLAP